MSRSFDNEKAELFQKNGTFVNGNGTGEVKATKLSFSDQETINKGTLEENFKPQIVWPNVVIQFILHAITLYGLILLFTFKIKLITFIFAYCYAIFSLIGVTGGTHRLWCHRSYKANLPLRIILMVAQTAALQNDIYQWTRDHRVHHKFSDTNADPHNVNRGFFFSHVGWLMYKKHPDVIAKGKMMDFSDVSSDPVVKFQIKYYIPMILVLNQLIPIWIPWYFFGEPLWISTVVSISRYGLSLNGTWLVNSAAHIWGTKPYDKNITPTECGLVISLGCGEGFHNYHHAFPWDYKAAELGNYRWNFTTGFIDLMAKIGWATDLKTASHDMIKNRSLRTGDGSWLNGTPDEKNKNHQIDTRPHDDAENIWGWGDKDMSQEEIKLVRRNNTNACG